MAKRNKSTANGVSGKESMQETVQAVSRRLAYVQVASSELARDINRDLVLERVRALQPVSRVDLARATGLQPSTISSIVEQLLAERWIRESAQIRTSRGRWPTMLSLNDDMAILVADVRATQAVVALVDLNGRFLERQVVPLGESIEKGVDKIADVMRSFRNRNPNRTVEGVGVSLPGRVDPATGQLLIAPNLRWPKFNLQAALERAMGCKVDLENAANASLLAELWFGHIDGIRNAVLVTISEGIGAAILAEGRLVVGESRLAGEFGHVSLDPNGPLCGCGQRGCWEMYASSRAALRYYKELSPASERMTIVELVAKAMDGERHALKALEQQAQAIGRGLHIVNAIVSPDVILFAGDITTFWEMSREIIERECASA